MLASKKFQDNFALAIIALIVKRNEVLNEDDVNIREELIKEFELNVNTLNKALDYLAEIKERHT
jgi:hypothetical protein